MTIRNLMPLATVVAAVVTVDALWTPAVLGTAAIAPAFYAAAVTPVAGTVDAAQIVVKIAAYVLFGTWIYLAGRNLEDAGFDDLDFTAASRVWWFFVPVASLFKPFQAMRELWNRSRGETVGELNHGLVSAWWALWIANVIVGQVLAATTRAHAPSLVIYWVNAGLDAALAAAAIAMIVTISRAQAIRLDGTSLSEVFA